MKTKEKGIIIILKRKQKLKLHNYNTHNRQEYEEDYKVRLMVTKKDKKKQQEKNEFKNSLEKLTRFDDIAMFSGEKDKKKLNEQRFAEVKSNKHA